MTPSLPILVDSAEGILIHSIDSATVPPQLSREPYDLTPVCEEEREALYADFFPLVRRLLRQFGEEPELRQDLQGEIYCRFCALLDVYDPNRGVPLRPYLVRQLTASVYTYARQYWRRRQREVSLEADGALDQPRQPDDPTPQWDNQMIMHRAIESLPDAIAMLTLRQRQVVIWRYYESRSFEAIAEALHIQVATARSTLRHALNNLRRMMARTRIELE